MNWSSKYNTVCIILLAYCTYLYIYIGMHLFICLFIFIYLSFYLYIIPDVIITSSTAQGGGGSFRIGNLYERLVVVIHGWQSESTDALKGGWSMLEFCFWSGCNGFSGHLTHNCWM